MLNKQKPDEEIKNNYRIAYSSINRGQIDTHSLGNLTLECKYCTAMHFPAEANKNDKNFSMCCQKGKVLLPFLQPPAPEVRELYDRNSQASREYIDNIRSFNNLLALASTSASLDPRMHTPGPYFYKICGQMRHFVSNSLTSSTTKPMYSQMYIFDTKDATEKRMNINEKTSCCPRVKNNFI